MTKNLDKLVMDERDPLSFLLHDLVHAYNMFNYDFKSQVGFYKAIYNLYKPESKSLDYLNLLYKSDEQFVERFDYLTSDMNTQARHLFYHFKAILINAIKVKFNVPRKDLLSGEPLLYFEEMFKTFIETIGMNEEECKIANEILNENFATQNQSETKKNRNLDDDFKLLDDFFIQLYHSN
jgi:hypothetical protein